MMIKGTKFTNEHKEKISNKLTGRKLSETHRKNLSKAKKGKVSNCAKHVSIVYKNVEYNFQSMTDAEKYFLDNLGLKIFYWLRRDIPKKYVNDVQLIKIDDFVKFENDKYKRELN